MIQRGSAKPYSQPIYYTTLPSDLGTVYIAVTHRGVCRITYDMTEDEFIEDMAERYGGETIFDPEQPLLQDAEQQIERYLVGELRAFDLPLHFIDGTPFYHRVWHAQQAIPYGQVRSYKWVAEQVGIVPGARAIGQANSKNRISFVIPCHRVINNDGTLGGYGDRIDVKAYLLRLEGAVYKGSRLQVTS